MSDRQVVVYSAANRVQAGLLRQMLDEHGIQSLVVNDGLSGEGGELPLGDATAPRVVVSARDAEVARELALRFERQITAQGEFAPHDWNDLIDDSERTLGFWPQCPECARKRTTICPYCGTSGIDFPWADEGDFADENPELWLECPVCDSAYDPNYLARCEWCGHRFASGVQPPPEPAFRTHFASQWNARLLAVVLSAAALLAMLGLYFAWLIRK